MASVLGLVDDLQAGRGGVVWVEGEPGIGKSTLISEMISAADRVGCTALIGSGDVLLEAFPLRLMAECLGISARPTDQARAEIADLLAGRGEPSGMVDPVLAAMERMLSLVDRLCGKGPLMLVAEDLHWADEPSLLVWNRLARATHQIPLLLVGSSRPIPARRAVAKLRDLVQQRFGTIVSLGPLDAAATIALTQRLAGAAAGPHLTAEVSRVAGNPLYLCELIEALDREGFIERRAGIADLRDGATSMPRSLTEAISRRLSYLTPPTLDALRTAALLGYEFAVGDWELALRRPVADVSGAMTEAVMAGLLIDNGGQLRFRHDLIRHILVEQHPPSLRGALHDDIARALAATDARLDMVARHLLAGSGQIQSWVIDWLTSRPEAALYAAADVAAELLRRAVDALDEGTPRWMTLAIRLAQVHFWLGRDELLVRATTRMLGHTIDSERTAALRVQAVRSLGRLRRFDDALTVAEQALAEVAENSAWHARISAWNALLLSYQNRSEEASDLARAALDEAISCDDSLGVAFSHHTLATMATTVSSQLDHIDAALAVVGNDPESTDIRMLLLSNRLNKLAKLGRQSDLWAGIREATVLAEEVGTYRGGLLLAHSAEMCYVYGRWDEALVYAGSIHDEYLDNPGLSHVRPLAALIALHRDSWDIAETWLIAGRHVGPDAVPPDTGWHFITDALALREEVAGRRGSALELRKSWLDLQIPKIRDARCDEALFLTRLALILGDNVTAEASAAACKQAVLSGRDSDVKSDFCLAMVRQDADGLQRAAADFRALGWSLHVATAFEETAVCLAGRGETAEARTAFNEAVRTYSLLGAAWDIRRADSRLRPFGIRRGPHSLHARSAFGWDALTPSETRIAELVARGMSNPEIAGELLVSRSTVETHVSHILSKLQLRSRVELAREVLRRSAQAGR